MAKNNNAMQSALTGAFAVNKKAKSHTNKSPFKRRQPRREPSRVNNRPVKKQPAKAQEPRPKKRPNYPWTCLLDVQLVGQLDAIQKTFDLNSRSEALAYIIGHSFKGQKLINSKEQAFEYKLFYKKFMKKNLPKAKRHYDKYFHK